MWLVAGVLLHGLLVSRSVAQMIVMESPLQTGSSSFYERNGVGFSFNVPGSSRIIGLNPNGVPTADGSIPFRVGGYGTIPPFGGYDPNADTTFGLGYRFGRGGAVNLNFAFGQGSDQTYTSTNPILVITNGTTGSVSDTTLRPFVTSIIPVLGDEGLPLAPPEARAGAPKLHADRQVRLDGAIPRSSAETGDLGVAEIRRQRQQERDAELDRLLAKARLAARQDRLASARVYFRNALRRAAGTERHSQVLAEYEALIGGAAHSTKAGHSAREAP